MKIFMKGVRIINKFRYVLLGITVAVAFGFYQPYEEGEGTHKKDQVILNLIYNVLKSSHFAPADVDNDFSENVFKGFLDQLDFNKRFLLKSDINELDKFRTRIDEQIKRSKLDFFQQAYPVYKTRFEEARRYFKETLSEPFDYSKKETLQTDDEELDFAEDKEELRERWRKYLKYRTLVRMEEMAERQQKAKANDDTSHTYRTREEMETKARKKEKELHEQWFDNLSDMDRLDWVGNYMNSIANIYDPHTQYFPPDRKKDFEINMTGQLEGIGAQLTQKGEYVTISKIIVGSACWKQGDLEVGDKILKVAQADSEAVSVVGMNVRKVVKYIRGPKGTEVRLTVQKTDGSKMIIPIIRDIVELESTFAKSAVLGKEGEKVGYIKLPKFYVDFYDKYNRNVAEDVEKEIEKLKKANVNGIVLDLRNNGGGSLQGVIDVVGLFIEEGPVVQVKAPNRSPRILKDEDKDVKYEGPLTVMVNQYSASASEIFAAAIQDYNRGLIVGGESTFGKGTVQNLLNMDQAVNKDYNDVKPLGALKVTIQKYYRINGGTPQLRGVTPDVNLPNDRMYVPFGEKEQDYALPYDEIEPAEYETWQKGVEAYDAVTAASQARVDTNRKFNLIAEHAKWLKKENENTTVNLNFEEFRQDREEFRQKSEKYDGIHKTEDSLAVQANEVDLEEIESSKEARVKAQKWHKNLSRDLYLKEVYHIVNDLEAKYP